MSYDKKFKLAYVKSFNKGDASITMVAQTGHINKQTLARWIRFYKLYGEKGLENRKPGVKEKPINHKFEALVLSMWKRKKRSAYKMRKDLKKDLRRNGYIISERQIGRVYKKHNLTQKHVIRH